MRHGHPKGWLPGVLKNRENFPHAEIDRSLLYNPAIMINHVKIKIRLQGYFRVSFTLDAGHLLVFVW